MRFLCFLLLANITSGIQAQEKVLRFSPVALPEHQHLEFIIEADEDGAGLLWFHTGRTLYRFDGNELLNFNLNSTPALSNTPVVVMKTDKHSSVWLGFRDGAARFDLKNWKISPLYPEAGANVEFGDLYIFSIGEGLDGTLYMGSVTGKLYQVRGDTLQLLLDLHVYDEGKHISAITSIAEPYPGTLWVTTHDGKIVCLPISGAKAPPSVFRPEEIRNGGIEQIAFHQSGKCIVARNERLFLMDTGTGHLKPLPSPTEPAATGRILFNNNENIGLMTGTTQGEKRIYLFDPDNNSWRDVTPAHLEYFGKGSVNISSGRNVVYISSSSRLGSIHFEENKFTAVLSDMANPNSVRSIYRHHDGKLYIGSYRDHFICYNPTTGGIKKLPINYVYSIMPWHGDSLLLGTEGGGLTWYEPGVNRVTPVIRNQASVPEEKRLSSPYITVLTAENDSLVWAGTYQGVFLVNTRHGTVENLFSDGEAVHLQRSAIYAIEKVGSRLLIASMAGLFLADPVSGNARHFHASAYERFPQVYCIQRLTGKMWFGTNGHGLLLTDETGNILDSLNTSHGLAGDVVFTLKKHGDYLFAGTDQGLSVIYLPDGSIRTYTLNDGLPATEFNHSAVYAAGDTLYMGTMNGIVQLDMRAMNTLLSHEPIREVSPRISSVVITDRNNQKTELYNLAYQDSRLVNIDIPPETQFVSLSFSAPGPYSGQATYYYRLREGDPLNKIGRQHEITFMNPTPGNYQLELAALLPGKKWLDKVLRIPLNVKPAYYQTTWFIIAVAFAALTVVVSFFLYREKQFSRERKLRIKIASDLHDEVGSTLTRLWYQAEHILETRESQPDEAQDWQTVSNGSREALSTMSDIIWSIDSRFDTLEELVLRMKDYVYRLRQELDAPLNMMTTGTIEKNRKVSQVIRQNLFLLFKEAINNAIRHGDGSPVEICLEIRDSLALDVVNTYSDPEDSVATLNPSRNDQTTVRQGGRGLQQMQRRADKMKAALQIKKTDRHFILKLDIPTL